MYLLTENNNLYYFWGLDLSNSERWIPVESNLETLHTLRIECKTKVIKYFISLKTVFEHIEVGIFLLFFPSTPTFSRVEKSHLDKELIMLRRGGKEIQ
jgi:hypothetical protein